MEAFFIFLLFVFVLIIFIILLNFKSSNSFKQEMILKNLDKLANDIKQLKSSGIQPVKEIIKVPEIPKIKEPEIQKEPVMEQPIVVEQKVPEIVEQKIEKTEKVIQVAAASTTKTTYQQEKTVAPKQKTDFEKFIGENLLNKIGMIVIVLALIFFGKYAVDKGWLNETAKVVSIIIIGGVLIGLAHRLRINYRAFSSVLAGGGIAALYIAIAVGFQLYHLFSRPAAFGILVVITILAILLSLAYNKKELAVIAIFGGFATPLMVREGAGNYIVLFSYILILDIGMLILAYFKKWNLVNFVANFATVILYMAWFINILVEHKVIPHQGALIFVSAFYLVFFLMNIINNIKENSKFTAFEFIMVITNSFLYFWAGIVIIRDINPDYMGLYTIALAVFNFAFAVPLYRRKQIDKNLVFLLIGLVLTFASIAVPVQFEGNYITMFWAAESVLLLWLSQKSGIRLMKLASYVVSILMMISLMMDWEQIYGYRPLDADVLPVIINKGFITGLVSVIAILVNILLLRKDEDYLYFKGLGSKLFSSIYLVLAIITLYIVLLLEIAYQVDISYNNSDLSYVALAAFNYIYLFAVLLWASQKKIRFLVHGLTALSIVGLLIHIFVVAPHYKQMMGTYLIGEAQYSFALLHYLTALSVLGICFYLWKNVKDIYQANITVQNLATWFSIIIGMVVLSFELDYAVLHITRPEYNSMYTILRQSHLIGWPILWGVIAFLAMLTGIRNNEKTLRIIGIAIFFFALLKLFIIDVWNMPAGGRIVAFISLGVLLLVISFMYQKLKRIILEDEPNDTENAEQESE